jgi:hypothetical protein
MAGRSIVIHEAELRCLSIDPDESEGHQAIVSSIEPAKFLPDLEGAFHSMPKNVAVFHPRYRK